jgi:Arc/MetJ-type ribon-helix-helix transcriptional regulator
VGQANFACRRLLGGVRPYAGEYHRRKSNIDLISPIVGGQFIMTITLKPEHERIIQEELQSGHFHSPDEVLDHALAALREKENRPQTEVVNEERVRRAQTAAATIRELRKGLSLGGEKIKDLIDEGRM